MSKEKFSSKDAIANRLQENGDRKNGMVWLNAKSAQDILDAVIEQHPNADIAIDEEHFIVSVAGGDKVFIPRWSHVPVGNEEKTEIKSIPVKERIIKALEEK